MADDVARRALMETGSEDAVTVNQRALIDKILARYAAEFTVFRELLQNADDAGATHCQLRFDSSSQISGSTSSSSSSSYSEPNLKATLKSWTFKNDGKVFGPDDWQRLRRIAEGNPDPDRIGAFGVGFYSLFSICEEPVVSSGDDLMGFFWKNGGDSLFTRRAKNPNAATDVSPSGNPWTSFFMALREPGPFPESPLQLARFLATSLTFTTRVRTVELWFDDHRLCKLEKTLEAVRPMVMPAHLNPNTPEKMMRVDRLESQGMQIDIEALALLWEGEREKIRAEREKAARPSLTAALTKSGGLTSMLQNAFGGGRSHKDKSSAPPTPKPASAVEEDPLQRSARLLTTHSAKALLRVATSHVAVNTDAQFKREIERSTKKPPPTRTSFNLIWVGKEEYDASGMEAAAAATQDDGGDGDEGRDRSSKVEQEVGPKIIFDGLMPKLDKMGNVFIGFRTHQTTGFAGHVAARFIPTVERESIDFIDRHCARWNMELLAVGGFTCRAVYETEMEMLKRAWVEGDTDDAKKTQEMLLQKALHTMRFFTMRDSSPSPRVSATFLATFFTSARQNLLTIASTSGIKPSSAVRLPNAVLLEFIKKLPVIPPKHIEPASEFCNQITARNLVKSITMEDVFQELGARALELQEMVSCLRWWISVSQHPGYDTSLRARLLGCAVVRIKGEEEAKGDTVQSLGSVRYILNPQRVPSDVALPPSCLASEVSKSFTAAELTRVYDWSELSIPTWLKHLSDISQQPTCPAETNVQLSPAFAERVLGIVSRSWGNLSSRQQQESAEALKALTCVATKKGMHAPEQSYFANVSLFEDLPIVEFPSAAVKGNLEKVLVALGVRKHVELQLIFTRLVSGGDWSHVELLTYLASNRESLTSVEVERLKKTAIWPKEGEGAVVGKDGKARPVRYRASQLYEPTETLRGLKLPLLDWSSQGSLKPWRTGSDEAKFAADLGLMRYPQVDAILQLASSATDDEETRQRALSYFLEKSPYRTLYQPSIGQRYAFVPCRIPSNDGSPAKMGLLRPTEVFTNAACQVMGFPLVAGVAASEVPKLQLAADPPAAALIVRLVRDPPRSLEKAKEVFEYLASVQSCFTTQDITHLAGSAIVPILPPPAKGDAKVSEGQVKMVEPNSCYFGSNNTVDAFRSVFLYVPDLGDKANAFLRLVGVSAEPSIEEVARRLVADPHRFYSLSGSAEAYLSLLRLIATNWRRVGPSLRKSMKQSSFLLASRRLKNSGPSSAAPGAAKQQSRDLLSDDLEDEGEDAGILVHELKPPHEVVVVDDANTGMIFGSSVFTAPHEDLLEGLYTELGSPRLSDLIAERYVTVGQLVSDTRRTKDVKALVLERAPLFLFEMRQSGNKGDIRRDAEWLKSSLEVMEWEGLKVSRTLTFQGRREQDVQKCSATAEMDGKKLRLYIAGDMELDWFEVAVALNRFLLSRKRLQEVLLFMTLLSTSLRDLKRRGFHVDKILQQRKAEREAYERSKLEQQRQAQIEALSRPSEKQIGEWRSQVMSMFPDADASHVESLLRSQKDEHLEKATNAMLQDGYPRASTAKDKGGAVAATATAGDSSPGEKALRGPQGAVSPSMHSGFGGFFSSWRDRMKRPEGLSSLASGTSSIQRPGGQPPAIAAAGRLATQGGDGGAPASASGSGIAGSDPNTKPSDQPSSLDNIRRQVLAAISASRPDASSSVQTQAQQTMVKEANSTYCDNSGVATDLSLGGEVCGMRTFLSPDLDPARVMVENRAALERLITQVYRPIGAIFGLDPSSMHVFVDTKGPTIAFNRGGTIWLNLRFYLAWHDERVAQGEVTDALISTYFTVAHEIAHNLEAAHNAQHEFYTSALCEQFFMSLATYIAGLQRERERERQHRPAIAAPDVGTE